MRRLYWLPLFNVEEQWGVKEMLTSAPLALMFKTASLSLSLFLLLVSLAQFHLLHFCCCFTCPSLPVWSIFPLIFPFFVVTGYCSCLDLLDITHNPRSGSQADLQTPCSEFTIFFIVNSTYGELLIHQKKTSSHNRRFCFIQLDCARMKAML